MNTLVLPDQAHAEEVIATLLPKLALAPASSARRQEIAENCVLPMCLLAEAVAMVAQAGPEEEAVFIHLLCQLAAHAEMETRKRRLEGLLGKLARHRQRHAVA